MAKPTKTRSKRRIDPVDAHVGAPAQQIYEGVWYALAHDIEVTECCHCGLVHETEFKMERGRLWWRSRIHPQATTAARRKAGIKGIKRGKPTD
jgi:hypothetical protein